MGVAGSEGSSEAPSFEGSARVSSGSVAEATSVSLTTWGMTSGAVGGQDGAEDLGLHPRAPHLGRFNTGGEGARGSIDLWHLHRVIRNGAGGDGSMERGCRGIIAKDGAVRGGRGG